MSAWLLRTELKALICLLIKAHPAGLRVLLGEYEPPKGEEIRHMLGILRESGELGVKVDGGGNALPEAIQVLESEEKFSRVINQVGGWGHITRVCCEWARHYEPTWRIVVDHAQWASGAFSRIDRSQLERIAKDHGVSRDTVWRRAKEFPGELASAILRQPIEKVNDLDCATPAGMQQAV